LEDRTNGFTLDKGLLLAGIVLLATSAFVAVKHLSIDTAVVETINKLSHKSYLLDHAINDFTRPSLSGAILVAMIWYVWFETQNVETRAGIAVGFVAASIAGSISRSMQLMVTTHPRPFVDPALQFLPPYSLSKTAPHGFSGFPSDHGAVFFGLAIVALLANRRVGTLALAVAMLSCFARIYLGLHYPSDIVGGAGIGILLVCGAYGLRKSAAIQRLISEAKYKPLFYAVAFYFSYGVADLFVDFRDMVTGIGHAMSRFQ
jgi:undecaprenyl-diphosphatase